MSMAIVAVGVDLAKHAFVVDGIDETDKVVLLKPGRDARLKAAKLFAPYRAGASSKRSTRRMLRRSARRCSARRCRFVPVKSRDQQGRLSVHKAP
jgi:hypothetical protein